jgi:hypothetical protein
MARGDLDFGLLLKVMKAVAESQDGGNPMFPITTSELMDLLPLATFESGDAALNYLDRHIEFLVEDKYLKTGPSGIFRSLRLTNKGQKFVQPELAEFGHQPMLPQVVKSLERQILTYPEEDKAGMLYRLREAVAANAPELFAKVIVEIGSKLVAGK